MSAYRDMTFCAASCANLECARQVTSVDKTLAVRLGLPFSLADFSARCPDYVKPDFTGAEIRADILREGCGE